MGDVIRTLGSLELMQLLHATLIAEGNPVILCMQGQTHIKSVAKRSG